MERPMSSLRPVPFGLAFSPFLEKSPAVQAEEKTRRE